MRVFVPGGTGFLGAAVTRELTSRGHEVLVGGRSALADVPMDIRSIGQDELANILDQTSPDVVLNLAGAGLGGSTVEPQVLHQVNSLWPALLADHIRRRGKPNLLHVASSTELITDDHGRYESAYSESKAEGSSVVQHLHAAMPEQVALVYAHNVYGSTQPTPRFVRWLIQQALSKSEVSLRYPDRVRDFIHVDDAAEAISQSLLAIGTSQSKEIGTGMGTSLKEVARLVFALLGADENLIVEKPAGRLDPFTATVANPDNLLGSRPMELSEGIHKTVSQLEGSEL